MRHLRLAKAKLSQQSAREQRENSSLSVLTAAPSPEILASTRAGRPRGRGEAASRGAQGQAGAVRPVAPRGQDPADRVRAVRPRATSSCRAATPGDLRLPGLHALLRKARSGRFVVKRKTQAKRMVRKLKAVRQDMLHRMHAPVREQHRWLGQILRGHYRYYGVIFNYRA